ncbi:conserved domain protein [Streptococcus cristatus ATCC 51100]|uniref:Conserved domain protein n=1 Tax=Streptococcus cristatus ATCC 51100 TaxID=889201 RepID=A0AAV3ECK5_STRCR|nr:conserved domain protein [Streptococcus cristatus ATCC 51100]
MIVFFYTNIDPIQNSFCHIKPSSHGTSNFKKSTIMTLAQPQAVIGNKASKKIILT